MIVQFREMASILEEFSGQMEQAADITGNYEDSVRYLFRRHHMKVENMLILEYENEQREAYLTVRTLGGRCVTSRDASDILTRAVGGRRFRHRKGQQEHYHKEDRHLPLCGGGEIPDDPRSRQGGKKWRADLRRQLHLQ